MNSHNFLMEFLLTFKIWAIFSQITAQNRVYLKTFIVKSINVFHLLFNNVVPNKLPEL